MFIKVNSFSLVCLWGGGEPNPKQIKAYFFQFVITKPKVKL